MIFSKDKDTAKEKITKNDFRSRRRLQIEFKKPSRTKQAFKDECDVNNILSKYRKTLQLTHVNHIKGNYGDFSNATDYQSALNAVMDANDRFMGLPSHIRQEFQNSPAAFIDFMSNDKNYDRALQLGLLDDDKAKTYLQSKQQPPQQPSKSKNKPQDLQNDD